MPITSRRLSCTAFAIALLALLPDPGHATPIDLNDFLADPEVAVAPDGTSAVLSESAFVSQVRLSNDPFAGDPEVIVAAPSTFLRFEYDFVEGPGDDDEFLADTRDQDYATVGHRAVVSGMFQFGLGGVAMRNNVKGHFQGFDLNDGDVTWWDPTLDILMPNAGWVITNDADLIDRTNQD